MTEHEDDCPCVECEAEFMKAEMAIREYALIMEKVSKVINAADLKITEDEKYKLIEDLSQELNK